MTPRNFFARGLSILGHPALLMPLAVVGSALVQGAPPQVVRVAAAACGVVAISVGVYSMLQVRAGRWEHVDASAPNERGQLHRLLLLLLFGMPGLLWWMGQPRVLVVGLAITGGVVAVARQLRRWLKVSLHAAFAAFAAGLLWPNLPVAVACTLLAVGVAWSRRVLGRHSWDVLVGLLLGAVAGLVFHGLAR